jgi:hypothetical protein
VRGVTDTEWPRWGAEGREMKRRSVCCNRDIAKTRTEVRVDWEPECESRALRVTVRERERER